MTTATLNPPVRGPRRGPIAAPLDPFIPRPDIREHLEVRVRAPAAVVMDAARNFDMQSLRIVRAIFRLRELAMRSAPQEPRARQGILADTLAMGWGILVDEPGRLIVCGAATQPWQANPVFTPIPAVQFAGFNAPDQVKIAWTLEVIERGPESTLFVHATRAVATDAVSRAKFRRYWRWARFGIVAIRLLLLPAIRREAERRWKAARPVST